MANSTSISTHSRTSSSRCYGTSQRAKVLHNRSSNATITERRKIRYKAQSITSVLDLKEFNRTKTCVTKKRNIHKTENGSIMRVVWSRNWHGKQHRDWARRSGEYWWRMLFAIAFCRTIRRALAPVPPSAALRGHDMGILLHAILAAARNEICIPMSSFSDSASLHLNLSGSRLLCLLDQYLLLCSIGPSFFARSFLPWYESHLPYLLGRSFQFC